MNHIESGARERHGDFLYNLTWRARKSDQKWLWAVVALVVFVKLTMRQVFIFGGGGILTGLVLGFEMHPSFSAGAIIGLVLAPVFEAIFFKKEAFGHTSNFIAVAGDMRRVSSKAKGLGKLIAKLGYLSAGAIALYCAICIYVVNRNRLRVFLVSELDVLGNALSKGGFWGAATKIHTILGLRNADCSLLTRSSATMQVAVSYALACKWMLARPGMDQHEKRYLTTVMESVMKQYNLPEEVTMRLKEGLI